MKRCLLTLCTLSAIATPASAQGIRGLISELFIFGTGQDPLFLAGTAGATTVQAHAGHFIPSAVESNGSLISFLTTAIGTNVSNIPLSSTSAGITFRFEGGVPVATSTSPGPIIAERAQTLGRGRVFIGANHSVLNFKSLRGVDLNNLRLNFTHVNADFPGCDATFGDDCTKIGVPVLENEVIELDLSMDLDVRATTFVLTYGLLDFVDIGVAVPVISTSLAGTSNAQVVPFPFNRTTAAHFFGGTEDEPDLFAQQSVTGSASGLGDIATRLKIGFGSSSNARFAILGDARWATGDAEDLLGAGDFSIRGLGIVSAQFGNFSPHANVGYVHRRDSLQNDAVLATVGFDHLMAPWAMIAVDLVSELQVGDNSLVLPQPLNIDEPFIRVINPTTIPDVRDDIVSASVGMKFVTGSGLTIIANSIWPLNDGSLRPHVMWTAGLEYSF